MTGVPHVRPGLKNVLILSETPEQSCAAYTANPIVSALLPQRQLRGVEPSSEGNNPSVTSTYPMYSPPTQPAMTAGQYARVHRDSGPMTHRVIPSHH